jgi:integrase
MATIFQMPGRPFWFYQITGADGKRLPRVSTKTTSKRDAKKMAEDAEAKERERAKGCNVLAWSFHRIVEASARMAHDGRLTLDRAEEMIRELRLLANPTFKETTLAAYWTEWNRHRAKQVAASTASNYGNALKKWMAAAEKMMNAPLTEITPAHIRDGITTMQSGPKALATTTAHGYISALKEVLDSALEEKLISYNPAASKLVRKARKATATKQAEKVGPFTLDEIRKLRAAADDQWQGMILFGFHTGLRLMDIAKLGKVNVDGATLVVKSAKTGTETRTPLSPQVVEWAKGREEHFFPKIREQDSQVTSNQFIRLMRKAGVPRDAVLPGGEKVKRSFHSLRHSFASVLANADVDKEVRMKLTGQTTSAVHANYTHHSEEKLTDAISKLPEL